MWYTSILFLSRSFVPLLPEPPNFPFRAGDVLLAAFSKRTKPAAPRMPQARPKNGNDVFS